MVDLFFTRILSVYFPIVLSRSSKYKSLVQTASSSLNFQILHFLKHIAVSALFSWAFLNGRYFKMKQSFSWFLNCICICLQIAFRNSSYCLKLTTQQVVIRIGKYWLRELQALHLMHFYKITPSTESTSAVIIITVSTVIQSKNELIQPIGEFHIPSILRIRASQGSHIKKQWCWKQDTLFWALRWKQPHPFLDRTTMNDIKNVSL